ncbi:MAG: hypothetical protein IPK64_10880 [bacterium]|nr:hypothetical protein [bacterium]
MTIPRPAALLSAFAVLLLALAATPAARAVDAVPPLSITSDLMLGGPGTEDVYILNAITSVAEDSRGNIYVVDGGQPALHRFGPDGTWQGTFAAAGDGPGDLMSMPVIAIDGQDRIHVAGMGGRVQVLDADFRHVAVSERAHATSPARALAITPDGHVAIVAVDSRHHTTVDLHDAQGAYLRSFCDTFAAGRDLPRLVEDAYGGGRIAAGPEGRLLFAQAAPYLVRILAPDGTVLHQTDAGGAGFIPEPEEPEIRNGRMAMRFPGMASGIAPAGGGRVMVSAWRRRDDGSTCTLLCLYDAQLNLLARTEVEKYTAVAGADSQGRVYLHETADDGTRVLRATVGPGGNVR